jgi:hypothetical protein
MQSRILPLLVTVGAIASVAALSSCGDPTALRAQRENLEDKTVIFALNGTPTTLPSGLRLSSRQAIRVDANFAFDIAFDINANNEVVVYTQRMVGNELVLGHPVGLQLTEQAFDAITRAPVTGYKYDSLVVLPGNRVLLVDDVDPICGQQFSILGPNLRAKIRLDSVVLSDRAMFITFLVNRNCGFRSLSRGLPAD